MNKTEILNRIEYLRNAIAYSRCEGSTMTIGQGICCNQEIASWFKVLARIDLEVTTTGQAKYVIPEHLENKVDRINRLIDQFNWIKP